MKILADVMKQLNQNNAQLGKTIQTLPKSKDPEQSSLLKKDQDNSKDDSVRQL